MLPAFCRLKTYSAHGTQGQISLGGAFCILAATLIGFAPGAAEAAKPDFLQAKMSIAAPSGAQNICNRYDWVCSSSGIRNRLTQSDIELVYRVNKRVNRQTTDIADKSQYRKTDFWSLPTSRGGDCEDFALLKKRELVRGGIAPERLLLATVLDRSRNAHAVLVLRTDAGDYVLDNLTDHIKPWRATRYTFLRMQDPASPTSWVGLLVGG